MINLSERVLLVLKNTKRITEADIEKAILEPGGSISFIAKQPSADERRYEELLLRLDTIARDIASLRSAS